MVQKMHGNVAQARVQALLEPLRCSWPVGWQVPVHVACSKPIPFRDMCNENISKREQIALQMVHALGSAHAQFDSRRMIVLLECWVKGPGQERGRFKLQM